MSTRRVYASWLPPNPRERIQLVKMKRSQRFAIFWMVTLIPSGWIAVLLVPEKALLPFTLFWIAVGLWLIELIGGIRCPRCGHDFCGKRALACWHGLFATRCEHCGLTLEKSPD